MTHHIFAYGTIKRGEMNHLPLMAKAAYKGSVISPPAFRLISFGVYPAAISGTRRIHGELFTVDDETFSEIDKLEGNGYMYDRETFLTWIGRTWIYKFSSVLDSPYEEMQEGIVYDKATNIETWSSNKRW